MKTYNKEKFLNKNINSMVGIVGNIHSMIRDGFDKLCLTEKSYMTESQAVIVAFDIAQKNPDAAREMDLTFVENDTTHYKNECSSVKDKYNSYISSFPKIDPEIFKQKPSIELWDIYQQQIDLIESLKKVSQMFGGKTIFKGNKAWSLYYSLYRENKKLQNLNYVLEKERSKSEKIHDDIIDLYKKNGLINTFEF